MSRLRPLLWRYAHQLSDKHAQSTAREMPNYHTACAFKLQELPTYPPPPPSFAGLATLISLKIDYVHVCLYVDERLSSKLRPPQQRDRPIRKVSLQEILKYRQINADRKLNLPTIGQIGNEFDCTFPDLAQIRSQTEFFRSNSVYIATGCGVHV